MKRVLGDGRRLAPEAKGTRPSRPRPWQAVAVAETAEGAGRGHEDPCNVTVPPRSARLPCGLPGASMLMGRKPLYISGFRPINLACARRCDERGELLDFLAEPSRPGRSWRPQPARAATRRPGP